MQTKQLTVLNKLGLHARPCALLAKTAGFFKSSITLTHNNHSVDAKSILGLMTMAVPAGTTLTVTAEGHHRPFRQQVRRTSLRRRIHHE